VLPLALAGCASPSPEYFGVEPQRRVIDGTEILVWQRGDRAQAIRSGWVGPGGREAAMARMLAATGDATGCAVRPGSPTGDSGVLTMRLDC
jgi:hypothetical protein